MYNSLYNFIDDTRISFIIGVGLIYPGKEEEVSKIFGEDKVKSFINTIDDEADLSSYETHYIGEDKDSIQVKVENAYRSVSVYNVRKHMTQFCVDDLKFVVFKENGLEPEWDDERCSYNFDWYNNDPEAFSEHQQELFKLISENRELFIDGEAICGAGC